MLKNKKKDEMDCQCSCKPRNYGGGSGAVYGLGMIGALVYFLQHATSLGDGLLGIVKAVFWPTLAAYHLLSFLKL